MAKVEELQREIEQFEDTALVSEANYYTHYCPNTSLFHSLIGKSGQLLHPLLS